MPRWTLSTRLTPGCGLVSSDVVGNGFRVEVTERLETQHRVNRGLMYRFFGEIAEPPDGPDDPALPAGTVLSKLLWQRLRVTPGEIRRRLRIAARIRPRRSLTGPVLAARAAAPGRRRRGRRHLGDDHSLRSATHSMCCPPWCPTTSGTTPNKSWCATPEVRTPNSSP